MVKQYQALFAMEGVELVLTDAALREIARRAKARGTGARGLRAVIEKSMYEIMYALPGSGVKRVVFDAKHLDDPLSALKPDLRQAS